MIDMALRVTEGVSGLWHYHLSRPGDYLGLCGARVMNSSLGLSDWKLARNPAHMPKSATYCAKCDAARPQAEAELRASEAKDSRGPSCSST